MLTLTRELHGIPAETLRDYLLRLGGENQPGGGIVGKEWRASIHQLPDYQLGKASFCSFLVEIAGQKEAVEKITQQFDLRIMRPGG
jgi:hypothetical protein